MTKRENIMSKIRKMDSLRRGTHSPASIRSNNSMIDRLKRMRDHDFDKSIKKEKQKASSKLQFIDEFGEDEVIDDITIPCKDKFKVWKR